MNETRWNHAMVLCWNILFASENTNHSKYRVKCTFSASYTTFCPFCMSNFSNEKGERIFPKTCSHSVHCIADQIRWKVCKSLEWCNCNLNLMKILHSHWNTRHSRLWEFPNKYAMEYFPGKSIESMNSSAFWVDIFQQLCIWFQASVVTSFEYSLENWRFVAQCNDCRSKISTRNWNSIFFSINYWNIKTVDCQLSTVYIQLSTIDCLLSTVDCWNSESDWESGKKEKIMWKRLRKQKRNTKREMKKYKETKKSKEKSEEDETKTSSTKKSKKAKRGNGKLLELCSLDNVPYHLFIAWITDFCRNLLLELIVSGNITLYNCNHRCF